MSGNVHGLSWFPNFPNKFVAWGQEICLYEVRSKDDTHIQNNRLPYIPVNYLTNETRYQYARCVAPSFHTEQPIIAVGLGDGKIGICNFRDTYDSSWEYTPRQQRICLCLAWNETEKNLLAIGHDRHRSDSCITLWDIERGLPKDTANFFGLSESAHSICWDKNHRLLIAGMSQKHIKLFDLRQNNATCQSIQTKSVHGLSVAPNGHYLCSFVDSTIMLWDLRCMERPLKQIQSSRNHLQISWCSTRTSFLSSIQRESPYLTLYDIRSVDGDTSREIYHIKKQISPFPANYQHLPKGSTISSLSWHPRDFERALVLADAMNILNFRLPVNLHTAYSNRTKLTLLLQRPVCEIPSMPSLGQPMSNCSTKSDNSLDFDTIGLPLNCDIMDTKLLEFDLMESTKQRALADYGVHLDLKSLDNQHLTPYLKNVWLTLIKMKRDERLMGLKTALGITNTHTCEALMASSRIESHVLQWPECINNSNPLICYRSEQRDKALQLCGWSYEHELDRFIEELCNLQQFSRAAMICVFHLKIILACNILSNAANSSGDPSMYRITAIALSSFNADRCCSTWRNQRSSTNMQIQDPHLRAIFSFLTMENDNFDLILNGHKDQISLEDRVAFACKYLSEEKLTEYVKEQIQKSIERGDLNGLLLTGESSEGIDILQSYIDMTDDVQTVALIAIHFFNREYFTDNRIQHWISSYLDILNSWGLWEKRAELDIKIENISTTQRTSRSVYLACNFCGKSVSNALQEDARTRSSSSNVNKLSSCPSCRKPLPRCSLCLLHMGTTLNIKTYADDKTEALNRQPKPFSKWFSWCQTCRHGGHTEHMMQWFKQNAECPVSSCSCRCFDMDALKPDFALETT